MSTRATTPAGRRRAAARAAHPAPASRPAKPRAPRSRPKAQRPPARPKKPRRTTARRRRRLSLPRPLRLSAGRGRLRRRITIALVLAAALAIGYFAWFRDSSLVAVDSVTIDGLSGGAGNPASAALTNAAEGMTTRDVDEGRLDEVASRFPEIASVSAAPGVPHGRTLHVVERPPVLVAREGGREVPVAADGTVLDGDHVKASDKLPSLPVDQVPSSGRLGGTPLKEALVLGAAPAPLRAEISTASYSDSHGVAVKLRGGIALHFGPPAAAAAKWAAVAAVLADRRLTTLSYIDVQVPKRPAVG